MAKAITTIGTMTTTPTRKSPFPLWWIAWLAAMLLLFGAPSLTARLLLLSGDPIRAAILEEKPVSDGDLSVLQRSRLRVVGWFPSNASFNDLALVALLRANQKQGDEAKPFLVESEFWQKKALLAGPSDPYGWSRLAYLFLMADGGPSSRSAAAWLQSVATAPFEPRLMVARVHMGMTHSAFLDEDAKALIPRLIRGAVDQDIDTLARNAKTGHYISVIEEALANDPAKLKWFRDKLSEL